MEKMEETIQKQIEEIMRLKFENEEISLENLNSKNEIYELEQTIIKKNEIFQEKSIKFEEIKNQSLTWKNVMDSMLIKFIHLKEKIQKMEQENFDLISEKNKLIQKSGTGLDLMTPRPKFRTICQLKNIDYDKLVSRNIQNQNPSTENIISNILEKYKDLLENNELNIKTVSNKFKIFSPVKNGSGKSSLRIPKNKTASFIKNDLRDSEKSATTPLPNLESVKGAYNLLFTDLIEKKNEMKNELINS